MVNTKHLRLKATAIFAAADEHVSTAISTTLHEAANEIDKLREAMQEFVDRCDRGEVRSTKTYNKFKTILGITNDRKDPV